MQAIFKSKRGDELVEASITMPLIIIITLVLMRTAVFFYEVLNTRVEIHSELINAAVMYDEYYIKKEKRKESVQMTGDLLTADIKAEIKLYSEPKVVRAGDLFEQ